MPGPGDEVLRTEHGFLMYDISARAVGATPVAVPERERMTDVDALLAACTERTRLVFLANPNNPTGTMIGGKRGRAAGRRAAGARRCWCSTAPMPNMSRASTAARRWSRRATTW